MNDRDLQIEAMYHLETAGDLLVSRGYGRFGNYGTYPPYVIDELSKRVAAAVYLVQAMSGGARPENFEKVLAEVREIDAAEEARDLVRRVRRGDVSGDNCGPIRIEVK